MLCGVAFVSTLAGSIASYFLGEDEAKWADMRLDEIHATGAVTAAAQSESQPTEGNDDDQER